MPKLRDLIERVTDLKGIGFSHYLEFGTRAYLFRRFYTRLLNVRVHLEDALLHSCANRAQCALSFILSVMISKPDDFDRHKIHVISRTGQLREPDSYYAKYRAKSCAK
jgi:hypothetical protein